MSRQYLLVRDADTKKAELFADGVQLWASDMDPDLLEELGSDAIQHSDVADVLDYLIDCKILTEDEADECVIDDDEDDEDLDSDDDELDEDEDDDDDELDEDDERSEGWA